MTDPLAPEDDGGTALTAEKREGLIPSYITLRSELNEAEQASILEAEEWAFARKHDPLVEKILDTLHKRMFGNVWKWAGTHRTTGKNIGVDAYRIATDLRQLLDDCRYWIENGTYEPDEIAARFHHRLVSIHCYPNGNGRHARLATDLLLKVMGRERFSWGARNRVDIKEIRKRYVTALQAADGHNIGPLLDFVRS
ncbi:MAG: mobile mystery protein B [Xanthomonadales bacterium]|nr:mobile mystery protein B [Xanthomonadales bacterium]